MNFNVNRSSTNHSPNHSVRSLFVLYTYGPKHKWSRLNLLPVIDMNLERTAFYHILYVFSFKEMLGEELLSELYEKYMRQKTLCTRGVGPFERLSDLHEFCNEIMREREYLECHSLSVHDFNSSTKQIAQLSDIPDIFVKYGKRIDNSVNRKERTNFFRRIFKED